jgi:uncharacterized protein YjbJ (UPF0337 family)
MGSFSSKKIARSSTILGDARPDWFDAFSQFIEPLSICRSLHISHFGTRVAERLGGLDWPFNKKGEAKMVTQETLQGNWEEIKGMLRNKWGQLTESDLAHRIGDIDQLTALIHRKTGEGRESIESYLRELSENASSTLGMASAKVKEYAQQASESFDDLQRQAADQLGAGYAEARRFVRSQPGLSLTVCFGLGLLAGLIIAMSRRA